MKHLLVGIDFSKSADRALAYAEEIALNLNAKITLVHVSPSPGRPTKGTAELQKQLAELADSIKGRGINTDAYLYEGPTVETLRRVIADGDCDLVVMGCQGEHFSPANPWGSTTTALMEDTRIPILAIPGSAPVKYPRKLLLAIDDECPQHLRGLYPLLKLLEIERTRLLLFHYLQSTERVMPDRAYATLLKDVEHRFYYQVDEHQPIGNAVVEFADLVGADMLVVTHRADHWLELGPNDSVAGKATWMASVPVLVLQDSF